MAEVDPLDAAVDAAWVAAALVRVVATAPEADPSAAAVLDAAGVDVDALRRSGVLQTRVDATMAALRQLAMVAGITSSSTGDGGGWAAQDDETLLAQGRASAFGGMMLARMAVPSLDGLSARFTEGAGGVFLDIGVGVAELSAAFCEALPGARVIALDVMPRVLDLARRTLAERGLTERVELRLQGVQDLDDEAAVDLAWLPAPFIPEGVYEPALAAIHRALRPGGWIVLAAGRLDDDALPVAVTRWRTLLAGGTPLTRHAAHASLTAAGFVDVADLPAPPGAPALYAARR
jgi:SAM-dependent methyltransferase